MQYRTGKSQTFTSPHFNKVKSIKRKIQCPSWAKAHNFFANQTVKTQLKSPLQRKNQNKQKCNTIKNLITTKTLFANSWTNLKSFRASKSIKFLQKNAKIKRTKNNWKSILALKILSLRITLRTLNSLLRTKNWKKSSKDRTNFMKNKWKLLNCSSLILLTKSYILNKPILPHTISRTIMLVWRQTQRKSSTKWQKTWEENQKSMSLKALIRKASSFWQTLRLSLATTLQTVPERIIVKTF